MSAEVIERIRTAIELAAEQVDAIHELHDAPRAGVFHLFDDALAAMSELENLAQPELPLFDDRVHVDATRGIAWKYVVGHRVVVSLVDVDLLSRPLDVQVSVRSSTNQARPTRVTVSARGGRKRMPALGRLVLERMGKWTDGLTVDHINHDPLDCTRTNLDAVTQRENSRKRRHRGGSSRYVFVSWNIRAKKWRVGMIGPDGKRYDSSPWAFSDEVEAARAADALSIKLWGTEAITNVKLGLLPPLDEQLALELEPAA